MSTSPCPTPEIVRVCLVGSVAADTEAYQAAQTLDLPLVISETGSEYVNDDSFVTYFVLPDFDGPIYEELYKSKHKLVDVSIFLVTLIKRLQERLSTRPER